MKIAVMSLGNVLMGDDALGPHVIARLRARYDFPPEVAVEDLGTPGLDLHPFLAGHDVLILVDVVKSRGEAGELRLYDKNEILRHPPQPRTSPHDPGLKEALLGLQFADEDPDQVLLVGIIPDETGKLEVGLSAPVREAVPTALTAVLAELKRLGYPATARPDPEEPDLWWEKDQGGNGMKGGVSWVQLDRIGVILVTLHSLLVGSLLFFIPEWTLRFAGWDEAGNLFFPRQSGAFHFVVAIGYFVEWRRCGSINLLLVAKSTAVIFLLVLNPWGEAWSVPFSGITDGLMLVGMFFVHRMAGRERQREAAALG